MWKFFVEILIALPLSIALVVMLAILAFFNPDKTKIWFSYFAYLLSKVFKDVEYYAIKWDIEGNINSFAQEISANINFQFPKLYVKWVVNPKTEEVVWEENKAIIVMRDRGHKGRNFVAAAHIFTSNTLLGNSSVHISKKQKRSMDVYATMKLLKRRTPTLVQQYMNDYFVPAVHRDNEFRELIGKYEQIERVGAFFPILVFEIHNLGTKVFVGNVQKSEVITEVSRLIDFLVEFSNREVGTYPEISFVGDYLRCAIRIIASAQTRQKGDTTGHVNNIVDLVDRSIENIYLIGSDHPDNKKFIAKVIEDVKAERAGVKLLKVHFYKSFIKGQEKSRRKVSTCLVQLQNIDAVDYIVNRDFNN